MPDLPAFKSGMLILQTKLHLGDSNFGGKNLTCNYHRNYQPAAPPLNVQLATFNL
jgi:hypothetical protein